MKLLSAIICLSLLTAACCHKKEITKQPADAVPACLRAKQVEWSKLGKKYRPAHITQYSYKGKNVYYVPTRCCDQMSEVYDENCNLICQPEGGFTGKGDGKCPDFLTERKDPKIVWEDKED